MRRPLLMRGKFCLFMLTAGFMLLAGIAQANLTIEITQGNDQAVPIAVVPFSSGADKLLQVDVASIISNDFRLSGQFIPVQQDDFLSFPSDEKSVFYDDWKRINVHYLITGHVRLLTDKNYRIDFQLFDITRRESVMKGYVTGQPGQLRPLAHSISDQIYHRITNIRGVFSTKLLYVLVKGKGSPSATYELVYADMDGHRPVTIAKSSQPILAPAWSPTRKEVAYVSYTRDKWQVIYIQNLATGKRKMIARDFSLSSSPAFSPDGNQLAMTLSKGKGTHIYVADVNTLQLKQVTFGQHVLDSEASWTSDGKHLIFTSNRQGSAQLYKLNVKKGKIERLTFNGNFNARAQMFPDGRNIALVHKGVGERAYHIAVFDTVTEKMRVLSTEPFEDSPSISPNGRILVFSSLKGENYVLGMVTADGRASYQLPFRQGDVQEPSWSPY